MPELKNIDAPNLVTRIQQDYEFAKAEREVHEPDWLAARQQFNCEWSELQEVEADEDINNKWLYVPTTLRHLQRIKATIQLYLFGAQDARIFRTSTRSATPMRQLAVLILDEILHVLVDIQLRPQRQIMDATHTGLLDGQGILKAGWRPGKNSGPTLTFVQNEHILMDPYALTPRKARFFIHEVWLDEEQLWDRQRRGIYKNVQGIVGAGNNSDTSQSEWYKDIRGPANNSKRLYKVLEYWGPQQLIGPDALEAMHRQGKHEPAQSIVATMHQDKLLRVETNPYAKLFTNPTPGEQLPFFILSPIPDTGSLYGRAMALDVRSLQREINAKRNQRVQAVDMEMSSKIFFDQTKLTDLKALWRATYGGAVPVRGNPRDAIYDYKPQTSTQNMMQEQAVLEREFGDVTGVQDPHMGRNPGAQRTATGVISLINEGNATQDTMIANIVSGTLVPMMNFFAACALKYVKPAQVAELIGADEPPPDFWTELVGKDYLLEMEAGSSATNKQMELQRIQMAMNTYGQIAQITPEVAIPAIAALTERMMRLLGLGDIAGAAMLSGGQPPSSSPQQGQQAAPAPQGQPQPVGV